ncbi:MAG: hypothetical protein IKS33_00325 [Bacteroidales bacterium]|nr:hypothetical protein [Bacteroidales bacterium]
MDTISLFVYSIGVVFVILGLYGTILDCKMRAILYENKIKTNCFTFYWSFKKFKDFIEENEFEDSVRMEYISLYKKAIWTKRIMLFIVFGVFLSCFIMCSMGIQ